MGIKDMHAGPIDGYQKIAASYERIAANCKVVVSDADAAAAQARDRADRIRRGEDVPGGLGKNFDRDEMVRFFKDAGFTDRDLKYCEMLASIPKEWFDEMKSERRTDERRATEKRRDFAELRAFIRKKRFEADVAEALKEQGIDDDG